VKLLKNKALIFIAKALASFWAKAFILIILLFAN